MLLRDFHGNRIDFVDVAGFRAVILFIPEEYDR